MGTTRSDDRRRRPRVGNAPCSWGVLGGNTGPTPWERMLDELTEAGYVGTELGDYGYMPTDPASLNEALEARGLSMLGAYVGVPLHRHDAARDATAEVLRVAELLASTGEHGGFPYLILASDGADPERRRHAGRITSTLSLDRSAWRTLTRNAMEVARIVRGETGLRTLFHPHCATYVETPDETERLLDDTDPELLNLVFDTGHHVYGSGVPDPGGRTAFEGLERYWERVAYVHLKDVDPDVAKTAREKQLNLSEAVRAGLFCELGDGSVDFGSVLDFLVAQAYEGWVTVEQDVLPGMGAPLASARKSRAYLAGLGV